LAHRKHPKAGERHARTEQARHADHNPRLSHGSHQMLIEWDQRHKDKCWEGGSAASLRECVCEMESFAAPQRYERSERGKY
jgi:hypothetical protein